MDWLHPTYGWALVAVPAVALLLVYALRARQRAMDRLGHGGLLAELGVVERPRGYRRQAVLLSVAVLLLAVALAGPRYGLQQRQVERSGVDLVVALDVSESMNAEDVAPNRLARSKRAISELLDELPGGRVGLVIFAGDAFIQCPLTTDYNAVRLFLDVAGPELVSRPGTDFGEAVRMAARAFTTSAPDAAADAEGRPAVEQRSRALLIVSDGENHVADLDAVRSTAREAGLTMLAAGIGTTTGAPIPIYQNGQHRGYKRDRAGEIVNTRLEEEGLRSLAQQGAYVRLTGAPDALADLPAALSRLQPSTYREETFDTYAEQYQWPLALGLLLLLAERLWRPRRTNPSHEPDPRPGLPSS